jgi:hypothetical protein
MTEPKIILFRVNDGINFKNSIHPFWGTKRGRANCLKTMVSKMNTGDICMFITNQENGGRVIGMAEYTGFYDRADEPILPIHTFSNIDQGWIGDDAWDIQIHYKNLYLTEKQNIKVCIAGASPIIYYESVKLKIESNLFTHYANFQFYAEPKKYKIAL